MKPHIQKSEGRLGVLIPGLGAVATTLIAGVEAVRKGMGAPIGSLTQMGTIKLEKKLEPTAVKIKDLVPLADLDNLIFGGWDVYDDNVYSAAVKAKVLEQGLLERIRPELERIKPMKAVFDKNFVKNLDGNHIKENLTRYEMAQEVQNDILRFQKENRCDRLVMIWCGSTEKYIESCEVFESLKKFEQGLQNNDLRIPPSMIYAYAALKLGIPFSNGAPNLTCDVPALLELAAHTETPISGKDFKTGQTLMKTIVAPGLQVRALGIKGWFSSNILGNRDGMVLDDPDNFRTKEVSKLGVLENILQPDENPDLYGDTYHKVRINYYPPLGDNKESWDNIDIFGWLGYSMQIKINFLCRDSILAAPLVLDLILFMDLAKRANMSGVQEWLSFYFKSPQTAYDLSPEHDIFKQLAMLHNNLRQLAGEGVIDEQGMDYQELVASLGSII